MKNNRPNRKIEENFLLKIKNYIFGLEYPEWIEGDGKQNCQRYKFNKKYI